MFLCVCLHSPSQGWKARKKDKTALCKQKWCYSSKKYLTRHGDVFKESIRLRKTELALNYWNTPFYKIIETEWLLHHELNFIFTACNKHVPLTEDAKFNYIKEVIIDKSGEIWNKMWLYKNIAQKLNTLIKIKNITLIGFFIPIEKKVIL